MNETPETPAPSAEDGSRRMRRSSRYNRVQERRAAQKAADNRFYKVIFGLITLMVLVTLLLAAIAMNGSGGGVDLSGLAGWTSPWLGPLSKMEAVGLIIVGIIAILMYRRIRQK
ncbi:hypothetical protein ACJ3XI_04935 [Litorimonas sp. RW-G-Af-16]|uniref:hypothetical protein n=1 Tax=Litorimonas sp. RW-G-Af-16 TaxID=3241168 RepID=UPI00390CAACA